MRNGVFKSEILSLFRGTFVLSMKINLNVKG